MPTNWENLTGEDIIDFVRFSLTKPAGEALFYYAARQYEEGPTYDKAAALYAIFIDDSPSQFGDLKLNLEAPVRRQMADLPQYEAGTHSAIGVCDTFYFRPILRNGGQNGFRTVMSNMYSEFRCRVLPERARQEANEEKNWQAQVNRSWGRRLFGPSYAPRRPVSHYKLPFGYIPARGRLLQAGFDVQALGF